MYNGIGAQDSCSGKNKGWTANLINAVIIIYKLSFDINLQQPGDSVDTCSILISETHKTFVNLFMCL